MIFVVLSRVVLVHVVHGLVLVPALVHVPTISNAYATAARWWTVLVVHSPNHRRQQVMVHLLDCDVPVVVQWLVELMPEHFHRNANQHPDSVDVVYVCHAHTLEPLVVNLNGE